MGGKAETEMSGYRVNTTFHTGLTVSDLDRAVAFFRDVLGGEVTGEDAADAGFMARLTGVAGASARLAFVKLSGHAVELIEYDGPVDKAASTLRPCDPGFAHISFTVDGIEALVAACRDHGFAAVRPVLTMTDGPARGTKVVYLRDPDGLTVELIEWAADTATEAASDGSVDAAPNGSG